MLYRCIDMNVLYVQAGDMSVENMVSTYQPHGILVVMAVDDLLSFQAADDMLNFIKDAGYIHAVLEFL